FHLHQSSAASSVLPYEPGKQLPIKGRIRDITVPAVSVSAEWHRTFGDAPVDLMKVDIEGLELDLARYEAAFLHASVRRIILEWHKWCVELRQLDRQLEASGFKRVADFGESDLVGLATYRNVDM